VTSAGPRDVTAFEAREALGQSGCAICHLSLRSVTKLIGAIAYEQVNDLTLRERLRRGGGFCNAHAHQWLTEAHSVLGTALIYRDVLQAALRELDEPASKSNGGLFRALRRGNRSEADCPLCEAQAQAEARYLEALLAVLAADPAARKTLLDAEDGLCRRHTLAALRSGHAAATYVVESARASLERTLADLDEVIRKEDYRFRHEERTDAQRRAPARAIDWAAGASGLIADLS
jgi:hypothetical protein